MDNYAGWWVNGYGDEYGYLDGNGFGYGFGSWNGNGDGDGFGFGYWNGDGFSYNPPDYRYRGF